MGKKSKTAKFIDLPSAYVKIAIEYGQVEIVNLPSENGWIFPKLCKGLPEGQGVTFNMILLTIIIYMGQFGLVAR